MTIRAKSKKKSGKKIKPEKIRPGAIVPSLISFWVYFCCFSISSDFFPDFARISNELSRQKKIDDVPH